MTLNSKQIKTILVSTAMIFSSILYTAEINTDSIRTEGKIQDLSSPPLAAAIFVRNNGGRELDTEIDTFNDMLSARLTDKNFAVMSWGDIIQKFREANETEKNIYEYVRSFMASATTTRNNDSITAFTEKTKLTEPQNSMTEKVKDVGVTKSSALRISQMLGAKYLIVASMGHIGHEKRVFKGEGTIYKTNNVADIYTLPLTVRILDGVSGQSIYGASLTAATRVYQNASLKIEKDNVADELLDDGTKMLTDKIAGSIDQIRRAALKSSSPVNFYIDCNVTGITVELDGAAIGTSAPGEFSVKPGLHQLKITRQYFQPWEQTVNIYDNQKLAVTLEFTTEGQAKFKDLAAFKQAQELEKVERIAAVEVKKQQSQANYDVKEKLSSGGEVFLKNSYIKSDGFAEQLAAIVHGY